MLFVATLLTDDASLNTYEVPGTVYVPVAGNETSLTQFRARHTSDRCAMGVGVVRTIPPTDSHLWLSAAVHTATLTHTAFELPSN